LFIFLISAFARMVAGILLTLKIKEVRKTEKFDSSRALKHLVFGILPKIRIESHIHHLGIKKTHHHRK